MTTHLPERPAGLAGSAEPPARTIRAIAFRAADVPLVKAADLRILLDAAANYPAWEDAIEAARTSIHLEMYLIHPDATGQRFRDRLAAKARDGVAVRLLCDWFGCFNPRMLGFWRPLSTAGGEVRLANPPAFDDVFGLVRRDHRKLIVIDRAIGFVSGLCVGDDWTGDRNHGKEPWRDTGVSFRGTAAVLADDIFRDAWRLWGSPAPPPPATAVTDDGDRPVAMGLVAASPDHAPVYRLDLALTAMASHRLWLTDAYFVPTSAYSSALIGAARRGVDVRVLVPGGSDLQWVGAFSRTFYRRLLEGGVRVYEWDGSMLHAKSAVADSRIVRVGSTNLNVSSWVNNWELDVLIDDEATGLAMEAVYERDLEGGTEIVLSESRRVRRTRVRTAPRPRHQGGRGRQAVRQVALLSSALGSAIRDARQLGESESRSLAFYGAAFVLLAMLVIWRPSLLAYPAGAVMAWLGLSLLVRAIRTRWHLW